MIGRFTPYIRAFLIAASLAVGPLIVAHFILMSHAESRGREELNSAAGRFIQRAERVINEAVGGLRLMHDTKKTNCLPASLGAYINAVRKSAFVTSIGLVDRNGIAMCLEPTGRSSQVTLLPKYSKLSPVVAIGVIEDAAGVRAAVVGWHIADGIRLVARLSPEALDIDPGPENLRSHMRGEIKLSDGSVWRTYGDTLSDGAGEWRSATVHSTRYPVEVTLSAPWSAIWAPVQPLHKLVAISAVAFGLIFVAFAMRITWQMKTDSGSETLEAIVRQEFVPYYQPVIDLETGSLRGCEMLARWVRADGQVIYPGAFMPMAESSGHVFEITRQLMTRSRDELGALYSAYPNLKVSINLTAAHFDDRRIVEDIVDIFEGGMLQYEQLVFELTERHPLSDIDRARRIIAELHSLGVKLALDDVGTGHSGLAYLQKLGVDIVKIDKMFIDTLISDENSYAIVDKLVDLAVNLNMGIVAEGVEALDQVEKLRELGVTAAQGFLFAPALPAKSFIELATRLCGPFADGGQTSGEIDDPVAA